MKWCKPTNHIQPSEKGRNEEGERKEGRKEGRKAPCKGSLLERLSPGKDESWKGSLLERFSPGKVQSWKGSVQERFKSIKSGKTSWKAPKATVKQILGSSGVILGSSWGHLELSFLQWHVGKRCNDCLQKRRMMQHHSNLGSHS